MQLPVRQALVKSASDVVSKVLEEQLRSVTAISIFMAIVLANCYKLG